MRASAHTTAVKPHSCGASEQKVRSHRGNVPEVRRLCRTRKVRPWSRQTRRCVRARLWSCAHTSACLAAVKAHRCAVSEQKVRSHRGNVPEVRRLCRTRKVRPWSRQTRRCVRARLWSCAHTSACLAAVKAHRCAVSEQKVRSHRGNVLVVRRLCRTRKVRP